MAQRPRSLDPAASAQAQYGALLRRWRLHRGLSQAELGRLVHVSGDLIGKIEKASRRPSPELVERLDTVLDAAGALVCAGRSALQSTAGSTRLGMSTSGLAPPTGEQIAADFHQPWDKVVVEAAKDWRTDMRRRQFLHTTGFAASASSIAALQWLLSDAEAVARASGTVTVGADHVTALRAAAVRFRQLDNTAGGAAARQEILGFLVRHAGPLVRQGRYDEATGAHLLSATAELTHLLGWASFDAGLQDVAQRHLTRALRLAKAAGDDDLGAEILAALSQQACYLRDGRTAIDLARAARTTAHRTGLHAVIAETHVLEAHGHACLGEAAACARSLSSAEATVDGADRVSTPSWIGYFDEAYLAATFAHCFRELGDSRQARRFAERSLRMHPDYRRGRMFNLALLATSHAQAGDVEAACAVAAEAVDLTRGLHSHRAVGYLRRLRTELAPYASSAPVTTLDASLRDAGLAGVLGPGLGGMGEPVDRRQ